MTSPLEAMQRLFGFSNLPNLQVRYNLAPTQEAPVVRLADNGDRVLAMLRWGLVPGWSDSFSVGSKMINARAETAADKPAFRAAFRERRCLVPADGFYEWRMEEGKKQPFRIGMKGGAPFAFAGLWERWTATADGTGFSKGDDVETFTILTTNANRKLRPIHERMPVILPPDAYAAWLAPEADVAGLNALLGPYPEDDMAFYRVTTRVNNVRNDDPGCIEPLRKAG